MIIKIPKEQYQKLAWELQEIKKRIVMYKREDAIGKRRILPEIRKKKDNVISILEEIFQLRR